MNRTISRNTLAGKGVQQDIWFWKERQYNVRYQKAGEQGPALVLIHGFGGNCDHWRKNIGPLSKVGRVFSIDLLGYGYSDKPCPKAFGPPNALYNFNVWAEQVNAFLDDVVHSNESSNKDTILVCNSVGGLVGLQAIADKSDNYKGIMLLNPSLRLLHKKKQLPFARPFIKLFQDFLRETPAGKLFFTQVATAQAVENILKEAYHNDQAVTQELVQAILKPGLEPGAVNVFLDFLSYSDGPLLEELIPQMECPVDLLWGAEDPWEPIEKGRDYETYDKVRKFIPLADVGHCPQDEAPELVNSLIEQFVSEVL